MISGTGGVLCGKGCHSRWCLLSTVISGADLFTENGHKGDEIKALEDGGSGK